MTIATRLRGAFALYLALLGVVLVVHARANRRAVDGTRALAAIAARGALGDAQLARLGRMSSDAEKLLVTHERGYLDRLVSSAATYGEDLSRLRVEQLTTPERAQLAPLVAAWTDVAQRGARLAGERPTPLAGDIAGMTAAIDAARGPTTRLRDASQAAMSEELARSEHAAVAAARLSWGVGAFALALCAVLSITLGRAIGVPLRRLAAGTREIAAGHLGFRMSPPRSRDEIALVTRAFNAMAERLEQVDQLKRDFVSNVSHDLKTPLSSIRETVGVLLDELPGPLTPRQRALLLHGRDGGERLARMVSNLLELSRLETRPQPAPRTIDVARLVHDAVRRARVSADGIQRAAGTGQSKRAPTVTVDAPERALGRGDPDDLERVLDNLLDNAIKFSSDHGVVRATVVQERDGIRVDIADEGPGIPDADKTRVFERFHQTAAGRGVRARGVGLGLAICRQIVAAHGGRIWVTDNVPVGTVLHVQLPVAAPQRVELVSPVEPVGATA